MTTTQWSPAGQPIQNPPCWGNPRSFDPNSRECRGCGVNRSCKETVDQQVAAAQPAAAWRPPQSPPTTPWQAPINNSPWTQTTNPWAQNRNPLAQWQPSPPQVQVPQQPQVIYVMQQSPGQEVYGRYNDPMHYAMAAAPLPPRLQMQGETFFGRFMKNVLLGALESVTEEALKGVRQMVLPPAPPNKIIDIK